MATLDQPPLLIASVNYRDPFSAMILSGMFALKRFHLRFERASVPDFSSAVSGSPSMAQLP